KKESRSKWAIWRSDSISVIKDTLIIVIWVIYVKYGPRYDVSDAYDLYDSFDQSDSIDYFYLMNLEWLKTGMGPLKDLLTYLNKETKTADVQKKQLIRELRNNLNIFHNAYLNNVSPNAMVDLLSNEAIKEAIKNNFKFKKLKPGRIEPYHVFDDRNKKYIGWDA